MIASLPMYDRPSNAGAHDRLWGLIRDNLRADGVAAPDALDRAVLYRETWGRRDLVVGQICVMPYRNTYARDVTIIGVSDYGLEGCEAGYFRSHVVCRADDDRDLAALSKARFAANARHSYSGFEAVSHIFAAQNLALPEPMITGGHDASVMAVANGTADFASIDAQTWAMQRQEMPQTANLRIVAHSPCAPGQSFITRQSDDPAPYFAAIKSAIAFMSETDKITLGLRDIIQLPPSAYA